MTRPPSENPREIGSFGDIAHPAVSRHLIPKTPQAPDPWHMHPTQALESAPTHRPALQFQQCGGGLPDGVAVSAAPLQPQDTEDMIFRARGCCGCEPANRSPDGGSILRPVAFRPIGK